MMARPGERDQPRPRTIFLLLYVAAIILGSLYPFAGWRAFGDWSAAFVTAPLPRYITRTDVTTNLLLYLPVGYLLALSLSRPRGRNLALLATLLLGAAFSLALESLQQLLPGRYASNLDSFLNTLGVLIGALLSLHHGRWQRGLRRFGHWRHNWFHADRAASLGLWLLLLWAFSQLALLPFPGTGWLELHLRPVDVPPESIEQINPAWLLAVFFEIATVGAFMACLLRPGRYASAVLLLFIAGFVLKLLAATLLLKLRVVGGVLSLETLFGFVLALWLLLLPSVARHRQATAIVLLAGIIVARLLFLEAPIWPGKSLLNIVGLAAHMAALWPWLALVLVLARQPPGRRRTTA
jgi:VanZ family protein